MNKTLTEVLLKHSVVTHEKDKGFINDITEWEANLFSKYTKSDNRDHILYSGYTEEQVGRIIQGSFDVYMNNKPSKVKLFTEREDYSWCDLTVRKEILYELSSQHFEVVRELGHRQPNFGKRPEHAGSLLFKSKSCSRFEHVSSIAGLNFDLQSNNPITEYILL